jgi:RNA exonuclease 4
MAIPTTVNPAQPQVYNQKTTNYDHVNHINNGYFDTNFNFPLPPMMRHRELDGSDHSAASTASSSSTSSSASSTSYVHSYKKRELPSHASYVAMDCEMVGSVTGESICARVVLIDWKGRPLLDTYVAPTEPVADYRTFVSGIRAEDLAGAPPLELVREQVLEMLQDKILVGHGLDNDLHCLQITHPPHLIRDTAYYAPFQRQNFQGQFVPRKLKELAAEKLGIKIQQPNQGAHDPHEDALAALNLYKQHRPRWEACVNSTLQKELKEQRRLQKMQQQQQQVLARQQQYYYNMMVQQQQMHQQQMLMPMPPIMSVNF